MAVCWCSIDSLHQVTPEKYEEGMMIVLSGPTIFQDNVRAYLDSRNFPPETVVSIWIWRPVKFAGADTYYNSYEEGWLWCRLALLIQENSKICCCPFPSTSKYQIPLYRTYHVISGALCLNKLSTAAKWMGLGGCWLVGYWCWYIGNLGF